MVRGERRVGRAQRRLAHLLAALHRMAAVEQHLGLDDRHDRGLLAQRCVARERVRVRVQAGVRGNGLADGDHGAPFCEARAEPEVLGEPLAQPVETLRHFLPGAQRQILGPLVDLDAWNDAVAGEVLRKRHAIARFLAQRLVEQDHAREKLLDARGAEQQPAVAAAVLLGARHTDRLEALLAGAARFVGGQNAPALRDHRGRSLRKQRLVHGVLGDADGYGWEAVILPPPPGPVTPSSGAGSTASGASRNTTTVSATHAPTARAASARTFLRRPRTTVLAGELSVS